MNSGYYIDGYDYGMTAATGIMGGIAAFSAVLLIVSAIIGVLMLVSMWKVFTKFGKPGWAAIVPIYNIIVMCEIAEKPMWHIALLFVPFANFYAIYVIYDGIAKKLGKTTGFVIGMMFLPFIFWPMLAFAKDSMVAESEAVSNDFSAPTESGTPVANDFGMPAQPAAPVVNDFGMPAQPAAPVVNDFGMPAQPAAPVANDFGMPAQPASPVANEEIQQSAIPGVYEDGSKEKPTSMWNNNNINNGQM